MERSDWRRPEVTRGRISLRGGEAGAGRRKWLSRWDWSVCVLVREAAGGRPGGRRRWRGGGRISRNSGAHGGGGGGGSGRGGGGGGGERKEEGGAERGGDGARRGRHHDTSPAPSSLRGAAPADAATVAEAADTGSASPFGPLRDPLSASFSPAAPRAAILGNPVGASGDPDLSAVPGLAAALPAAAPLPAFLPRASALDQRAVASSIPSCRPCDSALVGILQTRIWGPAGGGATGVTLFPSQDGAVSASWRPRFRLAPVPAALGGRPGQRLVRF